MSIDGKEGKKMEFLILFCSVPDKETGEKISRVLLENRLAACVISFPLLVEREY